MGWTGTRASTCWWRGWRNSARADRKQEEHTIVREILRAHRTREERVKAWSERTGESERAFYRRLAELS